MMPANLAFIGCGAMGAPMAERLIDAGHTVRIYDPNPAAIDPLVARGAIAASSPRDAAMGSEIAFACLPSLRRSAAAWRSTRTASPRARALRSMWRCRPSVHAPSRILPWAWRRRASPYSIRRSAAARAARGPAPWPPWSPGERATFDRVKPLLETIARNVFYIGEAPGLGQVTKLANNMISAAGMAAAFEASAMAVKAGVDARILIDTINASTGRNTATTDKFPAAVLTRSFDYGGKLSTMYKDVALCLEEARELNVPMWVGSNVVQLWFHAMTEGRGDDDYTTLLKMIENWAGVTVGGNESGPASAPKPK